jgi:replication fork protection complex subunit Tof1/Swi1
MSETQQDKAKADKLVTMMRKEEAMKGKYKRNAPTRHSRFGTAIWFKREDGKMSTITGQAALLDVSKRHEKMDSRKSFKPPKYRRKNEVENKDLGPPPKLNARATDQLRKFVEEFLDSGFNPLFQHVRRSIDRDAQHVLYYHPRQFFYLVSWFLRAERARQKANPRSKSKNPSDDISSFNLVAGVLNQEMFITLQRSMRYAWDNKSWEDLIAVMRCFTQILLSVQEMTVSGNEDDEEIADNILSRLFYDDSVHDLVTSVVRSYNQQGFDFLDAATELTHHFLRILESYSKKNVDMHVRSRRKARTKKKKQVAGKNADGTDGAETNSMGVDGDDDEGSGEDDEEALHKTTTERKFDFQSFAARFIPQGVVDTFVRFLRYYRELDDEQLKRAHRYFYRLAFKQEKSVMLFRVDIIHLLYNMIKGPEPLDKAAGMYKEWEELARQVLKKCVRKIQQRPPLIAEMLFSKTNDGAYYLETGMEKQVKVAKPRPAAELEFKHTEDLGEQIGILVGVLLDRNEVEHIVWMKNVLRKAEEERRAWMAAEAAMPSIESGANLEGGEGVEAEPKLPHAYSMFPYHLGVTTR